MKGKQCIALLLAVLMLCALAACGGDGSSSGTGSSPAQSTGNTSGIGSAQQEGGEGSAPAYVNQTGLPIVNEPTTVTMLVQKSILDLGSSWQEKECVKRAQEETGLTLEFTEISQAAWAEQMGVTLASGELPDVIVGTFPNFGKYLDSFMPLNSLIDTYAPALTAFYEERPELKVACVMEDGNIYSMPLLQDQGQYAYAHRYVINKTWLDNVKMDIPTTQDQLFDVMMAFKEQDANGNGDPNDELPFSMEANTAVALDNDSYGINFLMNSCGVHSANYVQVDDDVVSFSPTREEYRDFINFAHKLYSNGLIDVDGFVQQTSDFFAKGAAGRIGIYGHHSYADIVCGADKVDQYVPILPMQDKNGNIVTVGRAVSGDWNYDCYKISNTCEHPEAAVRLYDYVIGDPEVNNLWSYGTEGGSYTINEDGEKVRKIEFEDEGMNSFAQARHTFGAGMNGFWIVPQETYDSWYKDKRELLMVEFEEMYKPYLCTPMPLGIDKQEVVERRNDQFAEINTYIQNFTVESIMNGLDDAGWEKHLQSCERLNVAQYVEDYQNFYNDKKIA